MSASPFERHSAPIDAGFPDEWYEMSSTDHFWYRWRIKALDGLLEGLPIPRDHALKVLEIGCGRGLLRKQVEERTAWTVDGADLNEAALESSVSGRGRTLLYNILEQQEEFRGKYDVVILFDVIEHITEPDAFLRAAFAHLKPGGWMLVNVPALSMLFSSYDVALGHQRRYDKRSLSEEFSRGIGKVVRLRYWGLLLVPIALVRKAVVTFVHRPESVVRIGFNSPNGLVNQAFIGAMWLETALLSDPALGTSVLAAVQAKG